MRDRRDILIYYSLISNGDWNKMYNSIVQKEEVSWERYDAYPKIIKEKCITFFDDIYPPILKNIDHPPLVLYYKGDINLLKTNKIVSIVGTREPSELGIKATNMIVDALPMDYTVVSGMALGIDSAAHLRAINNKLKTIAILPVGIDSCYPIENKDLYEELCTNHLILSEHPFSEQIPMSGFSFRNRIIVGLSLATFIPEAYDKSGTMISVYLALLNGRDVICVPHPFDKNTANNRLIKDGADFVENAVDVLEILTQQKTKKFFHKP